MLSFLGPPVDMTGVLTVGDHNLTRFLLQPNAGYLGFPLHE